MNNEALRGELGSDHNKVGCRGERLAASVDTNHTCENLRRDEHGMKQV